MITTVRLLDPKLQSRTGAKSSFGFHEGVNLLVGPNGSGKSTVLTALQEAVETGDTIKTRLIRDPAVSVTFYDAERATVKLAGQPQAEPGDLTARHQSHGQGLRGYLTALENLEGEHVVVMDEPETALDFMAVMDLCAMVAKKAQTGVQFIISTHHPLFLTMKNARLVTLGDDDQYAERVLKALKKRLA